MSIYLIRKGYFSRV